jgi:hypothetical protein
MKKLFIISFFFFQISCSKDPVSKDDYLGVYNAMALIKGFQFHNSKISIYKIGEKYAMGFDIPDFSVKKSDMYNFDGNTFTLQNGLFGAIKTTGKVLNSNTVEITLDYDASTSGVAYSDYIIATK